MILLFQFLVPAPVQPIVAADTSLMAPPNNDDADLLDISISILDDTITDVFSAVAAVLEETHETNAADAEKVDEEEEKATLFSQSFFDDNLGAASAADLDDTVQGSFIADVTQTIREEVEEKAAAVLMPVAGQSEETVKSATPPPPPPAFVVKSLPPSSPPPAAFTVKSAPPPPPTPAVAGSSAAPPVMAVKSAPPPLPTKKRGRPKKTETAAAASAGESSKLAKKPAAAGKSSKPAKKPAAATGESSKPAKKRAKKSPSQKTTLTGGGVVVKKHKTEEQSDGDDDDVVDAVDYTCSLVRSRRERPIKLKAKDEDFGRAAEAASSQGLSHTGGKKRRINDVSIDWMSLVVARIPEIKVWTSPNLSLFLTRFVRIRFESESQI
jgi:hypothetical protein